VSAGGGAYVCYGLDDMGGREKSNLSGGLDVSFLASGLERVNFCV
jgi:hypothetical protein